ncbi:MAG TPA: FAD-binding oxidoreductase [Solirubrobacteraceae bacterium]|nr:FAD-binding oxidoreductase [Solirubrobacteraceae bacterium]
MGAEDVATALREAAREGRRLRIRGGGTKLGWGRPLESDAELGTHGLDEIVEHNEADLTAVLQAGVPLARAPERFAAAGQMLAVDPPGDGATVGGVVATADSGPIRHRYNAVRDLVVGIRVALPDGTLARAGGKVIKNVAGYDLPKLMSGAFGTLGVIVEMSVRLHPRPASAVTVEGRSDDPAALVAGASALAHLPLEAEALDLRWDGDEGAVLVQCTGSSGAQRAAQAAAALERAGLGASTVAEDAAVWDAQRHRQRARTQVEAVLRVSTTQQGLAAVLAHRRPTVARAALGLAWVTVPAEPEAVLALRAAVAPAPAVLLDAPEALRTAVEPWGDPDPAMLSLMRRVKARFDPHGTCNPGLFVGGL